MKHVMVDTETFGTAPGSILRSIGAAVFDPRTGEIGATFYANIDRTSCEEFGLTADPRTEAWWEDQGPEAQAALLPDQRHIADVLLDFDGWWREVSGEYIWSHGANFDEVLLGVCWRAVLGIDPPWKFWNVRCCRTVLALGNRRPDKHRVGIKHYALDDAKSQAVAVAATIRHGKFFV